MWKSERVALRRCWWHVRNGHNVLCPSTCALCWTICTIILETALLSAISLEMKEETNY